MSAVTLFRPVKRNALLYSEDFTQAAWTATNMTVTAAAAVGPRGATDGTKLIAINAASSHFHSQAITAPNGKVTASVYAKAAGRSFAWINVREGATFHVGWFDLTNGVVGSVSGGPTIAMVPVGNGWYRCWVTVAVTGLTNIRIGNSLADNVLSDSGDAAAGIYIWGAQLVVRGNPSVYARTTAAAR